MAGDQGPVQIPTERFFPKLDFDVVHHTDVSGKYLYPITGTGRLPCGAPSAVQFGGHTITFTPYLVQTGGQYDPKTKGRYAYNYKSYISCKATKNGESTDDKRVLVNFPDKANETFYDFQAPNETQIEDRQTQYPTLVAATSFKNKVWLIFGGNAAGTKFDSDVPVKCIFDIWEYAVAPDIAGYPFGGTWTKIDHLEMAREISGIGVSSLSNFEQVPSGGQATSILTLFLAQRFNATQPLLAFPTTDGKISTHLADMKSAAGDIKLGADIHAVTTRDSEGTPMAAVAWSTNSTYSTKQWGMGITFFDGKNFIGNAPTLFGKGNNGLFPIPQCIRIAAGTIMNRYLGYADQAANSLQIFGDMNALLFHWEYKITGPKGAGAWSPLVPGATAGTPVIAGINQSINFPDFFTAFTETDPQTHEVVNDPSLPPIPYYQNKVVLFTSVAISGYPYPGQGNPVGQRLESYYLSDQLIPFGTYFKENPLNPGGPFIPVFAPFVRTPGSTLDDEAYSDAWTLLGVFHGVPPSLIAVDPATGLFTDQGGSLSYSSSTSDIFTIKSSYSSTVGVGYEGSPVPHFFDLEFEFKHELASTYSKTTTNTKSFTLDESTLRSSPKRGFLLVQIPTYQAELYRRCAPNGAPIELSPGHFDEIYTATVTDWTVTLKPYNMVAPNTALDEDRDSQLYSAGMKARPAVNNLAGWAADRTNPDGVFSGGKVIYDRPPGASGLNGLDLIPGSSRRTTALSWQVDEASEKSATTTVDVKATFFGTVSGSTTQTFSNSSSLQFTSVVGISVSNNYPEVLDRVKEFTVTPLFFRAKDVTQSDFIPTKFRKQGYPPFLLTYNVKLNQTPAPNYGPTFVKDLTSPPIPRGAPVKYEVITSSVVTTPTQYQWYFNGQVIPGQTGSSFSIASVQLANLGDYYVTATDTKGTTRSKTAILRFSVGAVLSNILSNVTVAPGLDVVLQAEATGVKPLTFQWYIDGVAMPGATSPKFTVPGSKISLRGTKVQVVTKNALGSATETSIVTADPTAPVDPGSNLFAGAGYSPAKFRNLSSYGSTYDVVAQQGATLTARALPKHFTRIAWIDQKKKLVYAEFSGPGLVTVNLTPARTYYLNGTAYAQGLATITVNDSTKKTNLAIYSPGSNPLQTVTAEVGLLKINGNLMGNLDASGAYFTGGNGNVGIIAPQLQAASTIKVGNINALRFATPNLLFGIDRDFEVLMGGNLKQSNGNWIMTQGVGEITFTSQNAKNGGNFLESGINVTDEIVK